MEINSSFKTIKYCIDQNASVIIMSHMGRPKNNKDYKYSLEVLEPYIENIFKTKVFFLSE